MSALAATAALDEKRWSQQPLPLMQCKEAFGLVFATRESPRIQDPQLPLFA